MSFEQHVRRTLIHLAEVLEEALPDADVDLTGDILSITRADGRVYIINKHAPTQQLWLASPVSGAWHFSAHGSAWRDTRQQQALLDVLQKELGVSLDI